MSDKEGFDYRKLDEMIHSRARLGIMSILITVEESGFNFLKKQLKLTDGNLSVHLRKLEEAGYIKVRKEFIKRKPRTTYSITEKGRKVFEEYLNELEKLVSIST